MKPLPCRKFLQLLLAFAFVTLNLGLPLPLPLPLSTASAQVSAVRIHAGGGSYTDSTGNTWSADTGFTGGSTYQSGTTVGNTPDSGLYQTERWGNFTYAVPLPNGSYTLRLHFAEIYFAGVGQRKFNVQAEGSQVLGNYDIVADAGGGNRAVIKSFPVTVADGELSLEFAGVVDNAKVSAIEVVPASQTQTVERISGDNQTGTVATTLAAPFVVRVTSGSTPQAGVTVNFAVTSGGGTLQTATATTASNGQASTVLTLGTVAGSQTVSATVAGVGSVNFTATATATAPAKLALSPANGSTTIGTPISFQATIQDQYGNPVTTATSTVNFSSTGVAGTFNPASASASAGILASSFTADAAGSGTVSVTATGLTSATANLIVGQAGGSNQTVFTTQQPDAPNATDGVAYELGMKFQASRAGRITAVRYWKAASETGTHTGRLWRADGTLLGSIAFSGESASGWQQQALNTPIPVEVGVVYFVTVNANSHFAVTNGGLATAVAAPGGDIASVADGNNGVYGTTPGALPTSSYQNSNYFRDVVFVADNTNTTTNTLTLVSGDNQTGTVATTLAAPFVVRVTSGSTPQAGVTVNFAVTAGGGTLQTATATTASNGQASTVLTLGTVAGSQTVSATVAGVGSVNFTATATAAAANRLVLSPATASASPGTAVNYRATIQDQYGNPVTTATSTVNFSSTGAAGTFNPTSAQAVSGVAASTFTPTASGTTNLTATTTGLPAATATLTASIASRIHAGGGVYTDSLGNAWSADTGFTGGNAYQSTNTIAGTGDQPLYQTERWGNFTYAVPLPNGSYTLRLHFAEIYFGGVGQRVFNVRAENTQILSNYDIVADAGGGNRAVIKSFPVTVADGEINLQFQGVVDNAKVSAIEVVPAGQLPTLAKVSGDNQTATVGTALPGAFVVQVNDSSGNPLSGVAVNFSVSAGNGSVLNSTATTASNGRASTTFTLGTRAGLNTVNVLVSGVGSVAFSATGTPAAAVKLGLTPPSTATPTATPVNYLVAVQDQYGNTVPTANRPIGFSLSGVSGTPNPASTTTNSDGTAQMTLSPTSAGTGTITATATGLTAATARLTVAAANPIVVENRNTGSQGWRITNQAVEGEIEGYADATSVNRGGTIRFKVKLPTNGTFAVEIYRLGHYGGTGGRLITQASNVTGTTQPACPMTDVATRLVECNWSTSYSLTTGSNWTPGLYIAKLISSVGKQTHVWFVVRNDASTAKILYQSPFTNYQAYNSYGGQSLYGFNSPNGRAYKVSFDRPYTQTLGSGEFNNLLRWEHNLVRWLEAQGYDLNYATNVDFDANPSLLTNHQVFLSPGHDEYWSLAQRNSVENFRDAGRHLLFLSANTAYWRIRMENASTDGRANRVMACYKEAFAQDPVAPTTLWRDAANNRPENALLGVMYIGDRDDLYGGYDFTVTNSTDPYFANTGMVNGDSLARLVGFEWDAVVENGFSPSGLVVLSSSTVFPVNFPPGTPQTASQQSHSVRYTSPGGGKVFATGTIQWAWGLDSTDVPQPRADRRAQQITVNALADMGVLPLTPATNLVLP